MVCERCGEYENILYTIGVRDKTYRMCLPCRNRTHLHGWEPPVVREVVVQPPKEYEPWGWDTPKKCCKR